MVTQGRGGGERQRVEICLLPACLLCDLASLRPCVSFFRAWETGEMGTDSESRGEANGCAGRFLVCRRLNGDAESRRRGAAESWD